jgi:hypothetical protein
MQEFIIVSPGIIIGFFNWHQIYPAALKDWCKFGYTATIVATRRSRVVVLLAHSSSSQPFGQSASIVDVYTVLHLTDRFRLG